MKESIEFDKRYLYSMLVSIGISVIAGIVFAPTVLQSLPEGSELFIFLWATSTSFAINHVVNGPTTIMINDG